jgi:hypothetical protein
MSKNTIHGDNIAEQINSEDCYGQSGALTYADVWNIVDQLHTHFMDTDRDTALFEKWMKEIWEIDPKMETY